MNTIASAKSQLLRCVACVAIALSSSCGGGGGDSGGVGGFGVAGGSGLTGGGGGLGLGGGGSGNGFVNTNYQQNVAFAFEGVDSSDRKIVLTLEKTASSGAFTGNYAGASRISRSPSGDFSKSSDSAITGTYENRNFTLLDEANASSYAGTFVTDDVIELRSSTGGSTYSVRLSRNANGNFVPRMSAVWTFPSEPGRRIQLVPKRDFSDDDVTLLIEGTEFLNGTSSSIKGSVGVTEVTLQIERAAGTVTISGSLRKPSGATTGNELDFTTGVVMQRGGPPDALRTVFLEDNSSGAFNSLIDVDLGGVSRVLLSGDTLNVRSYFLSPNGQQVAFIAGATATGTDLYVVNRATKAITKLTNIAGASGSVLEAAWHPSADEIAFVQQPSSGAVPQLWFIGPNGVNARQITVATMRLPTTPAGLMNYRMVWSPSGLNLAIVANPLEDDRFDLGVVNAAGTTRRLIANALTGPNAIFGLAWSTRIDRDWLAFRGNTITNTEYPGFVAIVDPTTIAVNALAPVPNTSLASSAWSPNGLSVGYVLSGTDSLVKFDPITGNRLTVALSSRETFFWAPDSTRVAYKKTDGTWHVANGLGTGPGTEIELQPSDSVCGDALGWSPLGTYVAYFSSVAGECRLFVRQSAGAGEGVAVTQSLQGAAADVPIVWTADEQRVVFAADPSYSSVAFGLFVSQRTAHHALKISDRLDSFTRLTLNAGETFGGF